MPLRLAFVFMPLLCACATASPSLRNTEFPAAPLWGSGAPGSQSVPGKLLITERGDASGMRDRIAVGITDPDLTIFAAKNPSGTALLIIPGGGYKHVVMDKEGYEAARWFAGRGVSCFVLLYRLPGEGWSQHADVSLQDAQRAMRWIRKRSDEYAIDPQKVGVMGFSAGGHVAASLATGYDRPVYDRQDDADDLSARPDFAVLMYPVISMREDIAHGGSRFYLLGAEPSAEAVERYSVDRNVHAGVPRTFILHATDDQSVVVENSLLMYRALISAGVSTDLHLYSVGGHGFGLRYATDKPVGDWPLLVQQWIE